MRGIGVGSSRWGTTVAGDQEDDGEKTGPPDEQILRDFESLGVVGEESNKLVAYLAATSRKLDHPLAVIIQSSPAAGKSSLMDAVLKLFPTEDKLSFSAMTGRSLYYLGESSSPTRCSPSRRRRVRPTPPTP